MTVKAPLRLLAMLASATAIRVSIEVTKASDLLATGLDIGAPFRLTLVDVLNVAAAVAVVNGRNALVSSIVNASVALTLKECP